MASGVRPTRMAAGGLGVGRVTLVAAARVRGGVVAAGLVAAGLADRRALSSGAAGGVPVATGVAGTAAGCAAGAGACRRRRGCSGGFSDLLLRKAEQRDGERNHHQGADANVDQRQFDFLALAAGACSIVGRGTAGIGTGLVAPCGR
jgi:hypothetical protein